MNYANGFGNHHSSEAVPGALPLGQNSPQRVPFGLYAEQWSGSAFTAPRAENRRSWLYRLRPTAQHPPYVPYARDTLLRSGPFDEEPASPNRLRWDPLPLPQAPTDFIDGLVSYGGNGDVAAGDGIGIHLYAINAPMRGRAFSCADGEWLIVPQQGRLRVDTELGRIELEPQQIAVLPRGLRYRVEPLDGSARGYVCENYGAPLRLPELGRSAPTAWPTRAISKPRWLGSKTATSRPRWCRSSRAGCGRWNCRIRRSTWSPGTATWRRIATTCAVSIRSTPSASTIPTRRSSPC